MLNTVHSLLHLWCSFQRSSCNLLSLQEFCVHVDDVEISEKASLQCRLNHSNRSWNAGSNSSLCLVLMSFRMKEISLVLFRDCTTSFVAFLKSSRFAMGTRLKIWVATFYRDSVVVARSLVMRRNVRDVNRAEVVQISAISFIPSYCRLKFLYVHRSAICPGQE